MTLHNKHAIIIPKNCTIVVGFSGGPDSVYLLLTLKALEASHHLNLVAAHLDHEWRQESGKEAIWCQDFCKKQAINFTSTRASNISLHKSFNGSKEQHARDLRRSFFERIADQYENAYIALAHHKDDQLETFFIRLARGTSLQGLSGIKKQDGRYIRPLLNISKQEILQYLQIEDIPFLQDPSNKDTTFLRNRIRHHLTPILPSIDSRISQNIVKTMDHLTSVDNLLQQITQQTISNIALSESPLSLNTEQFLQLHPILQQRIMLQLLIQAGATFTPSTSLFAEMIRFLQTSSRKTHTMHQTYKVIKSKKSFSIAQS